MLNAMLAHSFHSRFSKERNSSHSFRNTCHLKCRTQNRNAWNKKAKNNKFQTKLIVETVRGYYLTYFYLSTIFIIWGQLYINKEVIVLTLCYSIFSRSGIYYSCLSCLIYYLFNKIMQIRDINLDFHIHSGRSILPRKCFRRSQSSRFLWSSCSNG